MNMPKLAKYRLGTYQCSVTTRPAGGGGGGGGGGGE